jgi:hypothetical protein
MIGKAIYRGIRTLGTALSAIALMLAVLSFVPPQANGGLTLETCGHADTGPSHNGSGGADKSCCDLCVTHCHLAWAAPLANGESIAYQAAAPIRIGLENAVGLVSDKGNYRLSRPRGPPVLA